MDRYRNFDRAFGERTTPTIQLTLFGREWTLPGCMPAAVPLRVARLYAEGRAVDDLTEGERLLLAGDMVPEDTLAAWLELGGPTFAAEELDEILQWQLRIYVDDANRGAPDPGEAPGPPPGPATRWSWSSGGPSSKPISDASTTSTSPAT